MYTVYAEAFGCFDSKVCEYRVDGYTRYGLECERRLRPPRATWGVNDGIAVGAPVDGCMDACMDGWYTDR